MDFAADIFDKKSFKKINCGRSSENVDVTLSDSISSKEVEFEKMLSIINVEALEILVGRTVWSNKKLELSVSIKLLMNLKVHILINQYYSHLTRRICNFNSNGEIKSLLKSFT